MAKSVSDNFVSFVISSFRGGISAQSGKGIPGSFKRGENLNIWGRDDVLTCNQRLVKASGTTVTDLILWPVKASDGNTYLGGDLGNIYQRTSADVWTLKHCSVSGRICGMWEWKESNNSDYIYFTSTAGLHRKPFPGNTNWTDVEMNVQALQTYDWHQLKQAAGVMAVGNDNYLGKVDYDGLFDSDSLNLRPGHRVKCLEELDDYVIIGSEKKDEAEEGHLWSWLTTATNWIQKKAIPAKGVNSMIDAEYLVCQSGGAGALFFSDMTNKQPLIDNPYANETYPGGVDRLNGMAMFGFFTSPYATGEYPGVYSYGRKTKNDNMALNLDYYLPITNASEIGCVAVVDGTLLVSYRQGSSYGVFKADSSNKANAIYESLEFSGGDPKYKHYKKKFNFVKVVMDAMPASTAIQVKYKIDRASDWTSATLSDGSTSFTTENETEAIFAVENSGKIFEVRVELYVSGNTAPVVHTIMTAIDPNFEPF